MDEDKRGILLPPVEGGTGTYARRGRIIDRLMGDTKIRARARKHTEALVLRSQQGGGELPPEPPPVKLPPPVPGGTGSETKGRRPARTVRPRQARYRHAWLARTIAILSKPAVHDVTFVANG